MSIWVIESKRPTDSYWHIHYTNDDMESKEYADRVFTRTIADYAQFGFEFRVVEYVRKEDQCSTPQTA